MMSAPAAHAASSVMQKIIDIPSYGGGSPL